MMKQLAPDLVLHTVIRPTLLQMDMWSATAEKLLFMIAAHESGGFRYVKQIKGPAVGLWQMEPKTLEDICNRYLMLRKNHARRVLVKQFSLFETIKAEHLKTNHRLACALARMRLAMVPQPFPPLDDDEGLARYAKTYWNTATGEATPEEYLSDYETYLPDRFPAEWTNPGDPLRAHEASLFASD